MLLLEISEWHYRSSGELYSSLWCHIPIFQFSKDSTKWFIMGRLSQQCFVFDNITSHQNTMAWFFRLLNLIVNLHWLPAVTSRVQFKLLLFVYKSLHNQSPLYIKDLLSLKPAANYAHLKSTALHLGIGPLLMLCLFYGTRCH